MSEKAEALERALACVAEIEKSALKLLSCVTMLQVRLEVGDFEDASIAGAILQNTLDGAARVAVPLADCMNLLNGQSGGGQ